MSYAEAEVSPASAFVRLVCVIRKGVAIRQSEKIFLAMIPGKSRNPDFGQPHL